MCCSTSPTRCCSSFFCSTTTALWRSGLVAALFAWHPLHVESVAWVAERKDVLSTFFCLLTLLAYAHFVEKSKAQSPRSKAFYCLALVLFACGLMCKPMLVTLPFVLLLLDFWPLNRLSADAPLSVRPFGGLIFEKVPFLALSLASSVITFLVQRAGGAVFSLDTVPFSLRITNSVVSYFRYVSKTFWPTDLAVFYPLPMHWPPALVLVSGLFVLACSVLSALVCPAAALPVGRLVLVSGHLDTGDWPGPGRATGHGGPVHVHPRHWVCSS